MATTSTALDLVLTDLDAEGDYLDQIVSRPDVDFDRDTPARGWTIGHQIGHLLWMDRVGTLACHDPIGFARQAEAFGADPERTVNAGAATEAGRSTDDLLHQWWLGRKTLLTALGDLPTETRVPWFGPSMSAADLAAVRIMETWAHGVDVTDALGLAPGATGRLHHVAALGVQTRDFAFSIHGRRSPGSAFRIELTAPDGQTWIWGPANATDRISGPALDFALLIAQRRHRDDLDLSASGSMAGLWLDIAQVFAGPAGQGRSPRAKV